jgi:hypothetical protein
MPVNGKTITVETIPGMGEGGDEGEWWRGWIQVLYISSILRTFVNATMYPDLAQKKLNILIILYRWNYVSLYMNLQSQKNLSNFQFYINNGRHVLLIFLCVCFLLTKHIKCWNKNRL